MNRVITLCLALALGVFMLLPGTASGATTENIHSYSVLFNENAIPGHFKTSIESMGGKIVYSVPEIGFAQVNSNNNILFDLKSLSSVKSVNPSISWPAPAVHTTGFEEYLTLDYSDYPYIRDLQWDVHRVTKNGASYHLGTGSNDVVVGIIDSGIDRDHPDLVKNLLPGSKNFVPAGGYRNTEPQETGNVNEFDDKTGHGSHIAGTIAANGKMLGVAPDTGIRAYRVFGQSSAETGWVAAAIIAAANDSVDVITLSLEGFYLHGQTFYLDPLTGEKTALGNDTADFAAYKRVIDYAVNKGCLVVTASGNQGLNMTNKGHVTNYLNSVYSGSGLYFVGATFEAPGTIPGVVTVSATGPDDNLAIYSNYGPGFIDLAAPGGDMAKFLEYQLSGRIPEDYFSEGLYKEEFCLSTNHLGGYSYNAGTSMAVPKAAAVASLIIDKYGKIGPKKVANKLFKKGVEPVTGKDKKYYGSGRLNAFKALTD
ncbi:MAG: S8 family serine peptidase [Desulfotomaculaceae bacterium]|nr:S8 family serine peptidase [Desulfotomaculaceae bacterium]